MGNRLANNLKRVPNATEVYKYSFNSVRATKVELIKEMTTKFKETVSNIENLLHGTYNLGNLGSSPIRSTHSHLCNVKMTTDERINIQAAKAWSMPLVSDIYEQTRPNYNTESVEFLLEKIGALKVHSESNKFTIVELGAGTGKFTRAILRVLDNHFIKNVRLVSTEPVKEMCEKFKEMVPNVQLLQCPAHSLSLPSNSADAALAAQCFHWFSNAESVKEIHRVLKPKGMLGIIWNLPNRSISWIKAIEEMFDIRYRKYNIARPETKEWLHQINNHGGFGPLHEEDNYRYYTNHNFQSLIERYKGISIVAAAEGHDKENMLAMIENEIKTNPDVKDQESYTFEYIVEIKWFQKN